MMAPGDAKEMGPMLDFALASGSPASIRYPKANAETIERALAPIELGRAEVLDWGTDGTFISFGALLGRCVEAARRLREEGLDVGVVNARFAKPLDTDTVLRAIEQTGFVLTVEEGTVVGGFGSAVLEAAAMAGAGAGNIRCLGIPDRFIEHGERDELLADLGLDVNGLVAAARALADRATVMND